MTVLVEYDDSNGIMPDDLHWVCVSEQPNMMMGFPFSKTWKFLKKTLKILDIRLQ